MQLTIINESSKAFETVCAFDFFCFTFVSNSLTPTHMKKALFLSFLVIPFAMRLNAQCSMTPNASTFIMSTFTVVNNYTLNSNNTYPISRAFYICQGTTVTIQNRPGNDTFYVAPGGGLVGFEPNAFRVFVQGSGSYNASSNNTYPISRAFYICQGTTVTIQNRPG